MCICNKLRVQKIKCIMYLPIHNWKNINKLGDKCIKFIFAGNRKLI